MHVSVMYGLFEPSAGHLGRLRRIAPSLGIVAVGSEEEAVGMAPEAEVMLGHRYLRQCLPHATRLRWVQSTATGLDRLPLDELREKGVCVTNAPIFHDVIARHALTLGLAVARGLYPASPVMRGVKPDPARDLSPLPRTAMVLGLGRVGRSVAILLDAIGVEVIGVRRHPHRSGPPVPGRIVGAGDWRRFLPETDWLVMALPFSAETARLVDEGAIRDLPAHAVVVNVGRGETLDTPCLIAALRQGRLGGAGLDVISVESSEAVRAMSSVPRLLVTPHMAAHHPGHQDGIERLAEEQMTRYVRGMPLDHCVIPFCGLNGSHAL